VSDETFVQITNREIYDGMVQLRNDFQRVESKVDSNSALIEEKMGALVEENTDLKKRTRGLELKFYGILAGLVTAIGIVVAGAAGKAVP
jgi:hypothetical protein